MKKFLVAVIAAMPFCAAPALAAPPAAPMFNWNGFYWGLNAGYGWNSAAVNINGLGGPAWNTYYPDPFRPRTFDRSGFIGGAQLGWNQQFNNIVLGLEADVQYSDMRGSLATSGPGPSVPYTLFLSQKSDWLATARGRMGVAISPMMLVYATAGLAGGEVSGTSNLSFLGGGGGRYEGSVSATKVGWTVGGGVEFAAGGNWTAKVEYLYYDLGTLTLIANTTPPNLPFQTQTDFKATGNIVRVGLNYKFGSH